MPEGDRFERSLGRGWSSAFRLAKGGGAPDAEVADKLVSSLAKTLREEGGVPGIAEMCDIIENAEDLSLLSKFDSLDAIVDEHAGHRHTKIASGVAKSIIVGRESDSGAPGFGSIANQFAIDVCHALIDHYFFSRVRHKLIDVGRLSNLEGASQWQAQIERTVHAPVEKIAAQLANRPDAAGLRSPKRTVPRQSTTKLLAENLLSL